MGDAEQDAVEPVRVLVYGDNPLTRAAVISALGPRPHPDLPPMAYLEVATAPMVLEHLDAGDADLAILDGEATPAGGLGVAKQLKDEIADCPPLLVLTGRRDDAWLADWSRADGVVSHPLDPIELGSVVIGLLRAKSA